MNMPWSNPFEAETTTVARVAAVQRLGLLDTEPEKEFDDLVQLAGEICGTPVSLLTLLDTERQFHKSHVGTDIREVPLKDSFCRYTVAANDLFVVADAAADPRFAHSGLVRGEPHVRFYAGVPLVGGVDVAVGALCVVDMVPRTLTEAQTRGLRVLGQQLSARLQLRARATAMETLALELQSERELFQGFLDSMPVETYLKDADGRMLFYNRRVSERYSLQEGEWLGKRSADLWSREEAEQIRREERYVLESNQASETYAEATGDDGTRTFWKIVRTPLQRSTGEMLLANIAIDLTDELKREEALQRTQDELEEANRKLRALSLTDELTNLWNRRAFDARLETEVYRAHSTGTPLCLLMIDVDDFKQLNDAHGHSHGDDVLAKVALLLRRAVRESDTAARFGGEEFAAILPEAGVDDARALCTRLNDELKAAAWTKRAVTVSIGIALCLPGCTTDELLDMADKAMYRAKRSGKNCVVAYEMEAAAAGS